MSPYGFNQQVVSHPGKRWEATVKISPFLRNKAEPWISFLLSLNGRVGTFLLSDPNCATPQGSASTAPGTPLVKGASQTGSSLIIDGAPLSATGYLKAGDYIQLGTGSGSKLHKVLVDANSDGTGQVTLDIWPTLRSSPADNDAVIVSGCVGKFRLKDPLTQWDINSMSIYGITFECMEAL
jgi:hypothetical protein